MKSTFFLTAATLFFTAANAQVTDTTTRTTTGTRDSLNNQYGARDTSGYNNANTGNSGYNNMGSSTGTTNMGVQGQDTSRRLNSYGSYSTRDSIAAKYKLLPMPGALTMEKAFPILGSYQLNQAADTAAAVTGTTATGSTTTATTTDMGTGTAVGVSAPMVTITMDSASKGIVWVEGLQQGRFKAYLKKSPATYRIMAQKSAAGTAIPEGTLHLDQASNTLHIAMGLPYNETDPTAVFAMTDGLTAAPDNTAEVKVKTKTSKTKSKVTFFTATKVDATQQMQQQGVDSTQQQQQQQ